MNVTTLPLSVKKQEQQIRDAESLAFNWPVRMKAHRKEDLTSNML